VLSSVTANRSESYMNLNTELTNVILAYNYTDSVVVLLTIISAVSEFGINSPFNSLNKVPFKNNYN